MADVVIFGRKWILPPLGAFTYDTIAHTVWFWFTVHQQYMPETGEFEGLPVVPFEELKERFPPDAFSAFAPLSHRRMNRLREEVYREFKSHGYSLISYISSRATRFPESPIGENCLILEDNTIHKQSIGDNVILWSGNHIGHHFDHP